MTYYCTVLVILALALTLVSLDLTIQKIESRQERINAQLDIFYTKQPSKEMP